MFFGLLNIWDQIRIMGPMMKNLPQKISGPKQLNLVMRLPKHSIITKFGIKDPSLVLIYFLLRI